MATGVEDAIRRQIALGKKPSVSVGDDLDDEDDAIARKDFAQSQNDELAETVSIENVPPGKAFGPGAKEGPPAPGALANLGGDVAPKPSEPQIQGRKPHPDPYIERGMRILGELDMHNAEHESEIQKLMDKPGGIQHPDDQKVFEHRSGEIEHNKRARGALLKNIQGLSDAYYSKGEKAPEEGSNEPGMGSKIWEGIKTIGRGALDTGKYVGQHPIEAAKDIGHGVKSLASLPERLIGASLPEDSAVGKFLTKRFQTDPEAELHKSHQDAGVFAPSMSQLVTGEKPSETGPAVMKGVGEALLPIGPTIKAGQMLRNVVKGGATTAGITAGEMTANKQEVTPEAVGGAAVVGGAFGGVLGKLVGRGERAAAAAKEAREPSAGGTGGPDTPQGTPPGAGELVPYGANRAPMQGQLEHNPPMQQGGPAPLQIEQSNAIPMGQGAPGLKQLMGPKPPALPDGVPPDAVEIPVSGFNRQFSKVWRTKDGSLIGETRGGEIVRADKQPTPLSIPPEGMPERGGLQRLLDAKRFQRDVTKQPGVEPPTANTAPEQPFSGQPKPGLDLAAKPLPGSQPQPQPTGASQLQQVIPPRPTTAPQPQMQPAASAQPKPQSQVVGPPQAGAPPLKVVNPTPQAQENVSVLKQLLGRNGQPQPQPQAPVQAKTPQPAPVQPKKTSAEVSATAKPQVPAGKNTDMLKWARQNEFEVREFPSTGKVEIRNPITGEKVVEFNTKDPVSRAKAAEKMQRYEEGDEKSTVKLYSGVDVGEAWKGAKALAKGLKERGSALFGEGHDEHSPLIRGLKTGAALQRGGKTTGKIVTNANEAERMTHKVVEDLRYEAKEGGGYKETQFELYMRMPESERAAVDRVVRDFDKLERIPTAEELSKTDHEYLRLSPEQKAAVHGTQEFSAKVHKYMQEEIKERVLMGLGKKTGEFTPKAYKEWLASIPEDERKALEALEVGIGKKEFYYPHKWDGHFEVHEVDPGTGISTGRKMIKAFEGARSGEGSSTVRTMYQANRLKQQAQVEWGVTPDRLKVVARDQPGASKHLETRKGAAGYEQEKIAETYLDYARSVAHWVEMSKMQRVAGDLLKDPNLGNTDKAFLLKYVERVAGKPAAQDMFLNHLMQHIPVLRNALDPYVPFSHVAKGARQFTTATALGVFNAASALVNADGVARHVWPALARLSTELKLPAFSTEKYMLSATKAWTSSTTQTALNKLGEFDRTKAFASQLSTALKLNEKNKNLLQKMAHEGVLDIQLFGERLAPAEKKAERGMRLMMGMFATTEDFSRGVASVAAYRMAIDAGLSEQAALQKAFQLTSSALGRYTKAGKPMIYSSEIGGTLGIFKTYLHVMIDNAYLNMSHPVKDFGAFSRYALAALGISGLTGLLPGTADIDELATKAFGKSPQAWLHKNLPLWAVDGIPTLFGTDLSSRAGAPEVVPNKGEDWLGATWSKVVKPIGSLALAAGENTLRAGQGEPTSFLQDILPALKAAAPNTLGLRYLVSESEDRLKGSRDRTIIKGLTDKEKVIKGLGLPLNREVQARQQYQVGENLKGKWTEERKRLVDLFLSGDEATRTDWGKLSHKYAITPRMLREEAKRKGQTLTERQRKSLPKPLRSELKDWDMDQPEF